MTFDDLRHKTPRRSHLPPRMSRVSHHPPLTLAHLPLLTLIHLRPIVSPSAGPLWTPGQRVQNGLPRFGVAPRNGKPTPRLISLL